MSNKVNFNEEAERKIVIYLQLVDDSDYYHIRRGIIPIIRQYHKGTNNQTLYEYACRYLTKLVE